MIRCEKLVKHFEGRTILNGIDLTMEQSKITCLIGPSGSGKTTLLRALSLLEPADSGTMHIEGIKYEFPLDGPLRIPPWPDITVVFQSLFLWPHMTLRENVLFPAKQRGMKDADKHLAELIKFFEMENFIDRFPNEASRGQQQRVALARGLMLHPKYIFLDEITSALDVEQVAKVLEYLQKLRDRGIGIFIITHLLGFAKRASDQVLFLNNGVIEEAGGPEILEYPKSERLKNFVQLIEAAS
jgi:glutamine transport system ATP-binding protein